MAAIILATLNARYFHSSLGLRYLLANMGELQAQTELMEFIVTQRPLDIVASLLARQPTIIGFGVYIWNVEETTKVVALLKQVRPDIIVVLGGPEVSYETGEQPIVRLADHVLTGPADLAFGPLCGQILTEGRPPPLIAAEPPPLAQIALPYRFYTDEDIANRLIYVEASRGCPFRCEFCLSALDRTVWPFDPERFLGEMHMLYERGARQFKFVDRTFNLSVGTSRRILEFFRERLDDRLFLHFELIPDRLPDPLKSAIAAFPPGSLQLEIGVQTFNPRVQTLIRRRQDDRKTEENLIWLRRHTHAHLHADLIAGLPGEDLASFGQGFNRLAALNPHEIQVGILKRLRGAPISRHTGTFGIRYNPYPPYNILCSDLLDFATVQRLSRFARYWDLIANSGRFQRARPLLLGEDPFERFLRFSDWLYAATGQTHQFALDRLFDLVYQGLTGALGVASDIAYEALAQDYRDSGAKGYPGFLRRHSPPENRNTVVRRPAAGPVRQARHNRR